jgi:hypothetical protein
MTRVWEHSRHKGSALLLLLAIADHAHDDGSGAWPSVAHLARKVRMSERQVQRVLRTLSSGIVPELGVEKEAGPGRAHLFTVLLARDVTGDKMSPPAHAPDVTLGVPPASPRGDIATSPGGDIAVSPKPSPTVREPSEKSSADDDVADVAVAIALRDLQDLKGYPFEATRDAVALVAFHGRRPKVALSAEIARWADRRAGIRDQRKALLAWLEEARDAAPDELERYCVTPGCLDRGYGSDQFCMKHRRGALTVVAS